ncbi:MAG: aminotransferase class I/II-fold pyridoxal phosphate-dependent enzyme [Candidatus Roizmanbacteria bacterium]|nr:aminotransferase class I/II-fold pyridoxal phosphate-dependent enzyme [Candidatus Roizmanbacteria bacterium]MCR4312770.1 aminotransferase class I/II-fold pyridoxal phosphate-dependent enzyme [Candidatus Roizmanbacteria bacterium]
MENLKIANIKEANRSGISELVKRSLNGLEEAQRTYPNVIMDVIRSGKLERQLDLSEQDTKGNSRIDTKFSLSDTAGAYFFNEEIIGGSREKQALIDVNGSGTNIFGTRWNGPATKLKLGPGVGQVEAPTVYRDLINAGIEDANLSLNYTAPFGTMDARRGIKDIMDARIDPEGSFFPDSGVFITEGATEGIDLFMEAIAKIDPGSRVLFLGIGYYTGPYSAFQKDLKIDRLVTNPVSIGDSTRFFPTGEEIKRSLPRDTSALVISSPNNPNGEVYNDRELTKIMEIAKTNNLYILFDVIFENMSFNKSENYRSRLLQIAAESGTLDKVVVVDSLSKTKNFAGERIGFMATTDKKMQNTLENVVLSRRCNPRLTLGPLLRFEGLARKAKGLLVNSPNLSLDTIVNYVMGQDKYPFSKQEFKNKFISWDNWGSETQKYYEDNLRVVKELLSGTALAWSPDQAAFNTFVKVGEPEKNINSMDYLAKLMYTMGTYTQVGPCFGLSQACWDGNLGIWPRITYASSRNDLIESLKRLVVFSRFYQEKNFGDPNKFPVLQVRFDNQI